MKNVFVYVRVSTNKQAEEGYSIPQQIERLKKYSDAMGWNILNIYTDDGYSGAKLDRPAIKQMLHDIESKRPNYVLVDKLDRISRSQFDTLYLIQEVFDKYNVGFVSRAESFDTSTAFGKAMVGILAVFAELERSKISERMIDGKEGRAKQGRYKGGGKMPIGYDYIDGLLQVNEYERMQVVELFNLYCNGMSLYGIETLLNSKGYRHKYGTWKRNTIKGIIQNPVYIGKVKHKGNIYNGLQEAIIDDCTFEKAQSIMAEQLESNKRYSHKYACVLSGLCVCGQCGKKYHLRVSTAKRKYWVCYNRDAKFRLAEDLHCTNHIFKYEEFQKMIFDEVRKLKLSKGYVEEIVESDEIMKKKESIINRISTIDSQISRLIDLYSIGSIDSNIIKEKMDAFNNEKELLQTELLSIESGSTKLSKKEIELFEDMFEECLQKNDSAGMHDILSILIKEITVMNESELKIQWNF